MEKEPAFPLRMASLQIWQGETKSPEDHEDEPTAWYATLGDHDDLAYDYSLRSVGA